MVNCQIFWQGRGRITNSVQKKLDLNAQSRRKYMACMSDLILSDAFLEAGKGSWIFIFDFNKIHQKKYFFFNFDPTPRGVATPSSDAHFGSGIPAFLCQKDFG